MQAIYDIIALNKCSTIKKGGLGMGYILEKADSILRNVNSRVMECKVEYSDGQKSLLRGKLNVRTSNEVLTCTVGYHEFEIKKSEIRSIELMDQCTRYLCIYTEHCVFEIKEIIPSYILIKDSLFMEFCDLLHKSYNDNRELVLVITNPCTNGSVVELMEDLHIDEEKICVLGEHTNFNMEFGGIKYMSYIKDNESSTYILHAKYTDYKFIFV